MALHFLLDQSFDPATRWFIVVVGTLVILYAVVRPFFRKKDPLDRRPSYASLSQQRAVEKQMQNVLVELSEMARQITAQLDTRAAKLDALLKEADKKIEILRGGPPPDAAFPPPPASPESLDPRHAQIYTLADQGRSVQEIAQQLDRPSGEVELILALRR
jgi:hypothetical protein